MKIEKLAPLVLSLSLLANSILSQSVNACAFSSQTYFSYSTHPDLPLEPFAAGKLGILNSSYARSYLFCAYKYLSGVSLTKEEQNELVSLWNERLTTADYGSSVDTGAWLKARQAVKSAKKIDKLYTDRPVSKDEVYQQYCNCQPAAFNSAIAKLSELSAKFGPDSSQVKQWLEAQDMVFANCGSEPYSDKIPASSIPSLLDADADKALKQERAYQIAAANFYAQNFEAARKEFDQIASDASSPRKQIAAYLAVRALIRQATLAKTLDLKILELAAQRIKNLLADGQFAELKADIKELSDFVSVRLSPADHLRKLVKEKVSQASVCEFTKTLDQILGDGDGGVDAEPYSKLPEELKKDELVDWILCFKCNDPSAKTHAVAEYKKGKSTAWLVSAISKLDGKEPELKSLMSDASAKLAGPGRWTLFYHLARLNILVGNLPKAKADLDEVLSDKAKSAELPMGSLNLLKDLRLPLAANLDEFIKYGFQNPMPACSGGCVEQVPDDMDSIIKGKQAAEKPLFTAAAGGIMQSSLPLSVLKQLAEKKQLLQDIRNNIAWTSWVRAALISDEQAARELAPLVKALSPAKGRFIDAYLAAASPELRKFAAAFLMLRYSSANPNPSWGPLSEDAYGDSSGWWWGSPPLAASDAPKMAPAFLTAAQKTQCKGELDKLAKVEAAPNYLSKIVIAFAKAHPNDPRVPEALHLAVKSTRYGVSDDETKLLSKEAFQILHKKYKGNTWTQNTPYYY